MGTEPRGEDVTAVLRRLLGMQMLDWTLNHGGYLVVNEPDPDPMGTGTWCETLSHQEYEALRTLLDEQPCDATPTTRCTTGCGGLLNDWQAEHRGSARTPHPAPPSEGER